MKKYLFILTLLFCTTAKANFYLKGGVGLNNIKNKKLNNFQYTSNIKISDNFPLIEFGLGYKFNNGIRIESVVDYYFLFRASETSRNINQDLFKVIVKTKANTIMFNAYKDIITLGNFTPFLGGGIGVAYLKESFSGNCISKDDNINFPLVSYNKNKYNFTYKLTVGSDIKINDKYTCELSYNYFNLGKVKRNNLTKYNYEIHNLSLNLRVII